MRLVLLGDPVAHSLSPAIHNAALRALGIAGRYEARKVDDARLVEAVEEIRRGILDGANVTMPHKRRAAGLADHLHPYAARAGAVNTLVGGPSGVEGLLTDVGGVVQAWEQAGLPDAAPVTILGAGGAAAAALLALEGRRPSVQARRREAATELVDRLGITALVVPWGEEARGSVLVNATPLGMRGERLPLSLADAEGLFDMAYGSTPTPAVIEARARGIPLVTGLEMLIAQAAESFRAWTGRTPPEDAMREALAAAS